MCRFIVLSLGPCIINDEEIYILTQIFKGSRYDPLRDSDITEGYPNTDWISKISNVRPEKGGLPNQDFRWTQFICRENRQYCANLGHEQNPPNNKYKPNNPTPDSGIKSLSPLVVLCGQLDNSYV